MQLLMLANIVNFFLLAEEGLGQYRLNSQGLTAMVISIGMVLALVSYCLYRVFSLPPVGMQDIKGPLEIDTGDTVDAD